mmetsp:Transcript_69884/g.227479  ORF Transcript_69884/g.227479 Transcript_69884/m.227479 type:complete len:384 (-) Transcript_69884:2105-3256(-)
MPETIRAQNFSDLLMCPNIEECRDSEARFRTAWESYLRPYLRDESILVNSDGSLRGRWAECVTATVVINVSYTWPSTLGGCYALGLGDDTEPPREYEFDEPGTQVVHALLHDFGHSDLEPAVRNQFSAVHKAIQRGGRFIAFVSKRGVHPLRFLPRGNIPCGMLRPLGKCSHALESCKCKRRPGSQWACIECNSDSHAWYRCDRCREYYCRSCYSKRDQQRRQDIENDLSILVDTGFFNHMSHPRSEMALDMDFLAPEMLILDCLKLPICGKGHPLQLWRDFDERVWCDFCFQEIQARSWVSGCALCRHTVCSECLPALQGKAHLVPDQSIVSGALWWTLRKSTYTPGFEHLFQKALWYNAPQAKLERVSTAQWKATRRWWSA